MLKRPPKRLVYTRHPQCLHNVAHEAALKRGIENRKSPLTVLGEMQCTITAEYLRKTYGDFDAVFCSTYSRTRALPVAACVHASMTESPLLDERSMGVWHTTLKAKVLEMYPAEEDRLNEIGYYEYEAPEGESCIGVENRLASFIESDLFRNAGEVVYISGHGISGLCLRRILTRATVADWHAWRNGQNLRNASVTVYERTGDTYECTSYNHVPWLGKIDPVLLRHKNIEA